jgi:hypothetical protein
MNIKAGELYINKTMKYLLPVIKDYGQELSTNINNLFKLGFGVKDALFTDKDMNCHIFILVDTSIDRDKFNTTLLWLQQQPYYEHDYPFDDIKRGSKHMIVLKIPEHHIPAYQNFITSKFSKMYHKDDIDKYFKKTDARYKVLTKDSETLKAYVDEINKTFDAQYTYAEWIKDDVEIEKPINLKEEIFNFNLI